MQEIRKENLKYEEDVIKKLFEINHAYRYHGKPFLSISLFIAISLFAVGLTFMVNHIEKFKEVDFTGLILLILSIVFFIIHFNEKGRIISRMAAFQYKNDKPATYIVSTEGIKEITNNHEAFYKWETYDYYIAVDGYLLLYESNFSFRMFASKYYTNEEWKQLLEWINVKIKPKFIGAPKNSK